jgi:hypothetical protein
MMLSMAAKAQIRRGRAWATMGAVALLVAAVPASGSAVAGWSPPGAGSQMSLSFARSTAQIVGTQALVLVRCDGSRKGICNGTVTVSAGGRKHRAPFAVAGGSRQLLAVPVGSRKALGGTSGRAVARTVQPTGGYLRSGEMLRFR